MIKIKIICHIKKYRKEKITISLGLCTILSPSYVWAHLMISTTFLVDTLSTFYRWENWNIEKLRNCPRLHCGGKKRHT